MILYLSVRVVQQYEKMIVFRLGKTNEQMVRDPGLRFLVPVIDRPVKVDIREQFIEVPSQTTITKDNAPINVDFLIYWRIVDPLRSVVNVANFAGALQGVATTTLRAVIGDISLDEVLSKRDQINELLRVKLDEQTERWGGKVTTVEIREIIPPRDVQDAMNRQLTAERTRRAVDHRVRGQSPGGDQRRRGPEAVRDPQGRGRAPGGDPPGRGLQPGADPDLRRGAPGSTRRRWPSSTSRRSRRSATSPSTKFVIPTEFTRLLEPIVGYVGTGMAAGPSGAPRPPAPPAAPPAIAEGGARRGDRAGDARGSSTRRGSGRTRQGSRPASTRSAARSSGCARATA